MKRIEMLDEMIDGARCVKRHEAKKERGILFVIGVNNIS